MTSKKDFLLYYYYDMIQASKGHQMNACIHLCDFGTRKSHAREQERSDCRFPRWKSSTISADFECFV